jgi:hypothetical protein
MLLSAVPNPAYMNGTLGIDDTRAGMDALNAALTQYAAAGGSMQGILGIDNTPAGRRALRVSQAQYAAANRAMRGTLAIDEPEPAYAAAAAAASAAGESRFSINSGLAAYGQDASSMGMGTKRLLGVRRAVASSAAADGGRFSINSSLSTYGQDADSMGMGTTGSLGVNYAAPLTRGGFRGEIFDSAPMPTGNWKDAPTPVMLGTEAAAPAPLSLLTKVVLFAGLAYAVWQLFDLGGKAQPASARPSQASRRRLRTRTQRIASANK